MRTVTLPYEEYIELLDSAKILGLELLKNTVKITIREYYSPFGPSTERVSYASSVPEIIQYLEQRKTTAELENEKNVAELVMLKGSIDILEDKIKEREDKIKEQENKFPNNILNYFRR